MRERDRGDPDRRLAQFKQVRMRFDATRLSDRERQMIDELVTACHALESIYWRQSDPAGWRCTRRSRRLIRRSSGAFGGT